jgi:Ca2+-binding RTX toxin-like protein
LSLPFLPGCSHRMHSGSFQSASQILYREKLVMPKATAIRGTNKADTMYHDGMRDLYAGSGADTIYTAKNNYGAKIYGEDGNDTIKNDYYYSNANDWVDGGKGNDKIWTGAGADTAQGGAGADDITAGAGNDVSSGGAGSDVFYFNYERQYIGYDPDTYESIYEAVWKDDYDIIKDFNVKQDHIKIEDVYSYYGSSAPDVQVKDTTAGTWIGLKEGSGVLLENVHGYDSATDASNWLHIA